MTSQAVTDCDGSAGEPEFARYSALMRASLIAIGIDLGLIGFKYGLSLTVGNALLLADAFHSGGDLAISVSVLLSVFVCYAFQNSPRARRIEAFVVLVIAASLIFGSIRMFWYVLYSEEAGFILSSDVPAVIAIGGVSLILLITLYASRFKSGVGKRHRSDLFTAESVHTYSDFLTSAGVWFSLVLGYFGMQVTQAMSLIVSAIVFLIGMKLLGKSWRLTGIRLKMPFAGRRFIGESIGEGFRQTGNRIGSAARGLRKALTGIQDMQADLILGQPGHYLMASSALVLLLYLGTGFYQVKPYQTGLQLFQGRVVAQCPPGLHYHVPKPFGDRVLVDTSVSIRLESGFRTNTDPNVQEPEAYLWEYQHQGGRYRKVEEEAISISGDDNLLDGNFLCYYRIVDPMQYALNNRDTHEILRSLFTCSINSILGRYSADYLITEGRLHIQQELLSRMQSTVAALPLGIRIDRVYMQEAHPPIDVIPEYQAVASAREKKNRIIHEAASYANERLPLSRAQAADVLATAQADAEIRRFKAEGEAGPFQRKQESFNQYPSAEKTRMKWEAIEESFSDKPVFLLPAKTKRRYYLSSPIN